MRVIKFRVENMSKPEGERICENPIQAIKDELKRRLNEECKTEEEKFKLAEELCSLIKNILIFVEKDRILTAVNGDEPNTPEQIKELDKLLPEDEWTEENLVNELVLNNPDIPDEMKLMLQLKLRETNEE